MGIYTFSFVVELILQFVIIWFWFVLFASKAQNKHHDVQKFTNGTIILIGIWMVLYNLYMIKSSYYKMDGVQTILDFSMGIWLPMSFIPIVFLLITYSHYENFFADVNFRVVHRGKGIAKYFKFRLILKCLFNLRKLHEYKIRFSHSLIDSTASVDRFFRPPVNPELTPNELMKEYLLRVSSYLLSMEHYEEHERSIPSIVYGTDIDEKYVIASVEKLIEMGNVEKDSYSGYSLTRKGQYLLRLTNKDTIGILQFVRRRIDRKYSNH